MRLTLGPLLFNWSAERWRDFYARVADEAPIDRVVLGEVVCSKRQPFVEPLIPEIVERLEAAGKEVVYATLGLVTLRRERKSTAALSASRLMIEVNDFSALRHLPEGTRFTVGPLVNVYNESTMGFLAGRGAADVCLPPELPMSSITALAAAGRRLGIGTEIWAFGRTPLAISARCYHARLAGLAKDSCQFVCDRDPDGLAVETVEGQPFLAINGVQTLSESWCNLVGHLAPLAEAGVGSLRLSPHTGDLIRTAEIFLAAVDARISPDEAVADLAEIFPGRRFSNGFAFGDAGVCWS